MAFIFSGVKEKTINKVYEVDVENIYPNPHQPRRFFDENELIQLSESIKHNGILQPLTVRRQDRITSYNVCYTKLLRKLQFQ